MPKAKLPPENSSFAFLARLQSDYPEFRFRLNRKRFSYRHGTIFIGPPQHNFALLALHELGHALSGHTDYNLDVERLKIESEAWERAKTVYQHYQKTAPELLASTPWDEDFVQDSLDTYRDWLHQKSLCKTCGLTRYQTKDGQYHCPNCENFG